VRPSLSPTSLEVALGLRAKRIPGLPCATAELLDVAWGLQQIGHRLYRRLPVDRFGYESPRPFELTWWEWTWRDVAAKVLAAGRPVSSASKGFIVDLARGRCDHLPILADSLEDDGCVDEKLLGFLRNPFPTGRTTSPPTRGSA